MIGKPAAFDLTVVSPLNSNTLNEAGATGESAARKAEARKHNSNDHKCREPDWVCIPLVVETYGCWGEEARAQFPALQPAWPCSCSAASQRPSSQAFIRDLIQAQHLQIVLESSSPANRARLLSVAAPHASSGYQWSLPLVWACTWCQ